MMMRGRNSTRYGELASHPLKYGLSRLASAGAVACLTKQRRSCPALKRRRLASPIGLLVYFGGEANHITPSASLPRRRSPALVDPYAVNPSTTIMHDILMT